MCAIVFVNEEENSFTFRVYGWKGRKRKTWYDTGKENIAKPSDVWRMVHRVDFERDSTVNEVRKGQVVRLFTKNSPLEFCGFVVAVDRKHLELRLMTGLYRGQLRKFDKAAVTSATEILSCPLFYELRKNIAGNDEGTDLK